jgi:hypothetical protein
VGARRIAHELGVRQVSPVPGRAGVRPVLVRKGLVRPQEQQYRRQYRQWERDAPMQPWQRGIVGGVPLADGREAKPGTGRSEGPCGGRDSVRHGIEKPRFILRFSRAPQ